MADELKLSLTDDTAAGAASVEKNLQKIEGAAAEVQSAMDQAATAADSIDGAGLGSIASQLGKIGDAADEMRTATDKSAKSLDKLSDADESLDHVVDSLEDLRAALNDVNDGSGRTAAALGKIGDAEQELSYLRQQFRELQDELTRVRRQAANTELALDDVGDADFDRVSPGLQGIEQGLNDVSRAADRTEKQLHEAGDAAKKAGDNGGKSSIDWAGKITALNQALEIVKKSVEAVLGAVRALSADGSPAFVDLQNSIDEAYQAALRLADDPDIQNLATDLASTIRSDLIPAMQSLAKVTGDSYQNWKVGIAAINEFFGVAERGAAKAAAQAAAWRMKNEAAIKSEVARKREQIVVDDKLAEIEAKIAEDNELRNIAQSNSTRQLTDLIDLETEAMREQERAGAATAKTREQSYKRIELASRRLREVQKAEADAAFKEAERVAQAKIDEQKRFDEAVAASKAEQDRIHAEELSKRTAEANSAAERLLQAIEQAKGPKGGNLIDEARAAISPEATRAQLVKQAKEEARKKYIDSNRDRVDHEGKASGNTPAEQRQNQRKVDREMELAERDAGIKAFRGFNDFTSGRSQMIAERQERQRAARPEKFDNIQRDPANVAKEGINQADITGAQNSLIQTAAKQAQSRGQLDGSVVQALTAATQNQQNMVQSQEQMAQQIKQLQAALGQVGNATRNMNAQARRVGL